MEYERIPLVLKRFPFEEKMRVCQSYSCKNMGINGLEHIKNNQNNIMPWEIEIYALFALFSYKEYGNNSFLDRDGNSVFIKIINSIKNYKHPKLTEEQENSKFVDYLMIVLGLTQFHLQENIYAKYYRYKYIFNFQNEKIDVKHKFSELFGTTPSRVIEFGYMINFLFSLDELNSKVIDYVIQKYEDVFRILHIDRSNLLERQASTMQDLSDTVYGFKFFYQYPFIVYDNNVFLPLPHVIINATTTSILYRLTEGDDRFRSIFGKEVLEEYLHHILSFDSNIIEMKKEYKYKVGKQEKRTLDVLVKYSKGYVLIDSKSYCPSLELRRLDVVSIEKTTNRIADSIVQVYKHVRSRFIIEYNTFNEKLDYDIKNIFGVVLLLEDSYIRRERLYEAAAKKLNIEIGSNEYNFLCSNIKVLSLITLESIIFQSVDFLDELIEYRDNSKNWFNYFGATIRTDTGNSKDIFTNSIKELGELFERLAQELLDKKLIS